MIANLQTLENYAKKIILWLSLFFLPYFYLPVLLFILNSIKTEYGRKNCAKFKVLSNLLETQLRASSTLNIISSLLNLYTEIAKLYTANHIYWTQTINGVKNPIINEKITVNDFLLSIRHDKHQQTSSNDFSSPFKFEKLPNDIFIILFDFYYFPATRTVFFKNAFWQNFKKKFW